MAATFVSELLFQLLPVPSVHDVVVTRRDDGTEVLRVPAGDPYREGDLPVRPRAELDASDPEAFLRACPPIARRGPEQFLRVPDGACPGSRHAG